MVIAILDTETNWADQVMSIGVVVAETEQWTELCGKYYILPDEAQIGGMYESTLYSPTPVAPTVCTRQEALSDLMQTLKAYAADDIFAYNACFDRTHLPELGEFVWHDIMRLAAYRQHNPHIPAFWDCCSTGRLKRGYGVEAMLRLLSKTDAYCESHNAFFDARDELQIMRLLRIPAHKYPPLG